MPSPPDDRQKPNKPEPEAVAFGDQVHDQTGLGGGGRIAPRAEAIATAGALALRRLSGAFARTYTFLAAPAPEVVYPAGCSVFRGRS